MCEKNTIKHKRKIQMQKKKRYDMIFAINKLTDEFNAERRQTAARITGLQEEVQILTDDFIKQIDEILKIKQDDILKV